MNEVLANHAQPCARRDAQFLGLAGIQARAAIGSFHQRGGVV